MISSFAGDFGWYDGDSPYYGLCSSISRSWCPWPVRVSSPQGIAPPRWHAEALKCRSCGADKAHAQIKGHWTVCGYCGSAFSGSGGGPVRVVF